MDYLQGLMLIFPLFADRGTYRMVARLPRILARRPNKMVRQIWAMLTKKEDDKDPALVGPA
jgi:hypothetical protein